MIAHSHCPKLRPLALAALIATLAGCAVGPDYQRPASPLPADFGKDVASPQSERKALAANWWSLFGDETLDQLVDTALRNNSDLRQALARVEQAAAVAREADAAFLPQIDGQAGVSNSQASTLSPTYSSAMPRVRHSRTASLSTSYELDLWGRVRRADEVARATLLTSEYSRDAIRLSVAGAVSNAYLNLRALDAQLAVSHDTLRSREESLALIKRRQAAGLSGPLEVHQAEAALAAAQAQFSEQTRQRTVQENQLALLTAQPALKIASGDLRQLPTPPLPPAGLPADLIEARPDIRQAEATLIGANASIGLAKAGYFPKFTLTGSVGSESRTLSDLFLPGGGTWAGGLGLLMPILDWGRTTARVDQAKALNQQSLIAWENALQTAYKEVRDALVNVRENSSAETAQQSREESSQKALEIARKRHAAGSIGYLEVLDAQRTLNDAQLARINTRQARLVAAVDLFKALGGGWQAGQ